MRVPENPLFVRIVHCKLGQKFSLDSTHPATGLCPPGDRTLLSEVPSLLANMVPVEPSCWVGGQ